MFLERVALGNNKQIMKARPKCCARRMENQVKGLGFSLVEVLSPCPTIWKMDPVEAQRFVREEMAATFAIGNYRDRTATAAPRPPRSAPPSIGGTSRNPGPGEGRARHGSGATAPRESITGSR